MNLLTRISPNGNEIAPDVSAELSDSVKIAERGAALFPMSIRAKGKAIEPANCKKPHHSARVRSARHISSALEEKSESAWDIP